MVGRTILFLSINAKIKLPMEQIKEASDIEIICFIPILPFCKYKLTAKILIQYVILVNSVYFIMNSTFYIILIVGFSVP